MDRSLEESYSCPSEYEISLGMQLADMALQTMNSFMVALSDSLVIDLNVAPKIH